MCCSCPLGCPRPAAARPSVRAQPALPRLAVRGGALPLATARTAHAASRTPRHGGQQRRRLCLLRTRAGALPVHHVSLAGRAPMRGCEWLELCSPSPPAGRLAAGARALRLSPRTPAPRPGTAAARTASRALQRAAVRQRQRQRRVRARARGRDQPVRGRARARPAGRLAGGRARVAQRGAQRQHVRLRQARALQVRLQAPPRLGVPAPAPHRGCFGPDSDQPGAAVRPRGRCLSQAWPAARQPAEASRPDRRCTVPQQGRAPAGVLQTRSWETGQRAT